MVNTEYHTDDVTAQLPVEASTLMKVTLEAVVSQ